MGAPSYLPRPPKRPRMLFALTPLIDVMFLLLIFFMLSSQIAPFSLLPTERTASPSPSSSQQGEGAAASLVLRVGAGTASVGGRARPIAELRPLVDELASQGFTGVVVSAAPGASVQDVVSVLETLSTSGLASVTLLDTAP